MMAKNIEKAQKDLFNINSGTDSSASGENSSSGVSRDKRKSLNTGNLETIHEGENASLERVIADILSNSATADIKTGPVESAKTQEATGASDVNKVVFYQDNSESPSATGSDSDAPVDASATKIRKPKVSLKAQSLADKEGKETSLEKLVEATAQRFVKTVTSVVQEPLVATKRPEDEKEAVAGQKMTSSEDQTVVAQVEAPKVIGIVHQMPEEKSEEAGDKVIAEPNTASKFNQLASDEHAENHEPAEEYKKDESHKQIEAEIVEPTVAPTNEPTSNVTKSGSVSETKHAEVISEVKQAVEEPIVPILEIQLKEEQPNQEVIVKSVESSKGSPQEVEEALLEVQDEPQAGLHEALLMEQPKQPSAESEEEDQTVRQPAMPDEEPKPSALVAASLEEEIGKLAFERQDAEIEPSHTHGTEKLVAIAKMTVSFQAVRSADKLLEEEQSKRATNQQRIEKLVETIGVMDEYPNEIQLPKSTDEQLVFGHARVDETGDLKVFSGLTIYSAGFWATISASRLETEWTRLMRETTSSKFSKARFVQWRPRKDECFTPTKMNDPNAVYHILGHDDRKLQLFPGVRLALSEMAENSSPSSTHGTIMWNKKKTGMVLQADAGISKQKEALSTFMHWLQSTAPIDYFAQAQIGEDENQKASVIVHFPPLAVDEIDNCVDISVYYATIYKQVFMTVATRATQPSTIYLSVGKEATNMKVMLAVAFEAYQEFATKLNGADIVFVSE